MSKRAIFIGRWSPFHNGHMAIMEEKIRQGVPLLVMIRDTPYDLYPPQVRKRMIEAAMRKRKVDCKCLIIDDIESINYGREVGYEVNAVKVREEVKKISATEIRAKIQRGDKSWKEWVPPGADKVLLDYLKENGMVIWFTGLPKSGKSEIAKIVAIKLEDLGIRSERIDGKILRKNISSDLTFSITDREKNLFRAAYVCKLLSRQGAIVLASFVSPYEKQRAAIRKELERTGQFIEIYLKSSVERCKKRDTEGLYRKAQMGQINDFTGITAPFEEPKKPEIVLDADKYSINKLAETVVSYLKDYF